MLFSLGLAIAIWLITTLITWGWIRLAQSKQIHDLPERRRLHSSHTPRAGGISIALVMACTGLGIYFFDSTASSHWLLITSAVLLFSALGFFDDLKPLNAKIKLLLHLSASLVILLISYFSTPAGPAVSIFIALTYLLLVNIWNFMDGSNGMLGMQNLLYVFGFLWLSYFSVGTYYFALALAAACLAFLPFNFPVSRVFLGDVGSHVLGAAIGGLALMAVVENQWTVLEIACLFSVLWIDSIMTLIRRTLRGFNITHPHRSHLYQYAIRRGMSHVAVCMGYAAWTACMILLVGLSREWAVSSQRFVLLGVIAIGCLVHQCLRLFVLKSTRRHKKAS